MQCELTAKIRLESPCGQSRVARQFACLFEFGTIRESIVDGLHLLEDPRLSGLTVRKRKICRKS